jgi:hypothetical protein
MVKKEKVKKIIKQAIENCDSSLKEVGILLEKALKELNKLKDKKPKNNFEKTWYFDIKNSKLQNLKTQQKHNIINNINKMIQSEKNKEENKNLDFFVE